MSGDDAVVQDEQHPAEPTLDYLAMKRNPSATSKANLAREPRTAPFAVQPRQAPLNPQHVDSELLRDLGLTRVRVKEVSGMDFVARVGLELARTEEHPDRCVPVRVRSVSGRTLAVLPVRCSGCCCCLELRPYCSCPTARTSDLLMAACLRSKDLCAAMMCAGDAGCKRAGCSKSHGGNRL
jgi:hypothetical protein